MPTLSPWRARLARAERRLARARRAAKRHPSPAADELVKRRERRVRRARRMVRRHRLRRLAAFDGVPVFQGLALMLQDARDHGWSGRLVSADRREGVPERYGRLSQAKLYAAWVAWSTRHVILPYMRGQRPNPANPPNRSTHELRSDGVAYAGPVGRPLHWWQLGMDATAAEQLRAVLNELGYAAFRPYSSGSEIHHTNLRRSPWRTLHRRHLA